MNHEALQKPPIRCTPPFLVKLTDILNNSSYHELICWSTDGTSVIVRQVAEFSAHVLPKYFKHSKFSSFLRQLNTYNFHTRRQERNWREFHNPLFQRGREQLVQQIKRKSTSRKFKFAPPVPSDGLGGRGSAGGLLGVNPLLVGHHTGALPAQGALGSPVHAGGNSVGSSPGGAAAMGGGRRQQRSVPARLFALEEAVMFLLRENDLLRLTVGLPSRSAPSGAPATTTTAAAAAAATAASASNTAACQTPLPTATAAMTAAATPTLVGVPSSHVSPPPNLPPEMPPGDGSRSGGSQSGGSGSSGGSNSGGGAAGGADPSLPYSLPALVYPPAVLLSPTGPVPRSPDKASAALSVPTGTDNMAATGDQASAKSMVAAADSPYIADGEDTTAAMFTAPLTSPPLRLPPPSPPPLESGDSAFGDLGRTSINAVAPPPPPPPPPPAAVAVPATDGVDSTATLLASSAVVRDASPIGPLSLRQVLRMNLTRLRAGAASSQSPSTTPAPQQLLMPLDEASPPQQQQAAATTRVKGRTRSSTRQHASRRGASAGSEGSSSGDGGGGGAAAFTALLHTASREVSGSGASNPLSGEEAEGAGMPSSPPSTDAAATPKKRSRSSTEFDEAAAFVLGTPPLPENSKRPRV